MNYRYIPGHLNELLETLDPNDTVEILGSDFLSLIDGLGKDRGRGRKPIDVDNSLFDETVARWQNGELTAREAMKIVDLKPNTFYRRVKERNGIDMKDIKSELREKRAHLHEEAQELRAAGKERVHENVSAAKAKREEKKQLHQMEREIAHERHSAEKEYHGQLSDLRDTVAKEAKEMKKLAKESGKEIQVKDVEREIADARASAEKEYREQVKDLKDTVAKEAKELKKLAKD